MRARQTSLQMSRVCNKVAGSGDMAIREQGPSTVGTRVLAIATILSSFSYGGAWNIAQRNPDLDIGPHRNQILLGGRHQVARRLLLPALHLIESAQKLSG